MCKSTSCNFPLLSFSIKEERTAKKKKKKKNNSYAYTDYEHRKIFFGFRNIFFSVLIPIPYCIHISRDNCALSSQHEHIIHKPFDLLELTLPRCLLSSQKTQDTHLIFSTLSTNANFLASTLFQLQCKHMI